MRHTIVQDAPGFRALEAQWSDLLTRSGRDLLPLSHAWISAWWKNFGPAGQPCVYCWYDADELIAVAPMMSQRIRHRGIHIHQLISMINGHSPFWDMVIAPGTSSSQIMEIVESVMASTSADWARFSSVPDDSQLYQLLRSSPRVNGRRTGLGHARTTPLIRIQSDWRSFFSSRSRKFRKAVTNKVNRFARTPGCSIERYSLASPDDPAVDEMIAVSAASWKAAAGTDLKSRPDSLAFLRDLILAFGPNGRTSVWIARQDKRPIAYEFHVCYRGVTYPLRADFDESARELSPGSVVEFEALKDIFDDGSITLYDSCANDYWYLNNWTDERRIHHDILVYASGLRPRCLHALEFRLIPALRRTRSVFAGPADSSPTAASGR